EANVEVGDRTQTLEARIGQPLPVIGGRVLLASGRIPEHDLAPAEDPRVRGAHIRRRIGEIQRGAGLRLGRIGWQTEVNDVQASEQDRIQRALTGKLPAIGVNPWMYLSRKWRDVCVSRYWMYSGPFECPTRCTDRRSLSL